MGHRHILAVAIVAVTRMTTSAVPDRSTAGLSKLRAEGQRVIWWSDPEGEFLNAIRELSPNGAEQLSLRITPV